MARQHCLLQEAHLCVVGLGLMGGSLALALRGRVATLSAVESDSATRDGALERQVVSRVSADLALAEEADIIVLATPVQTIIRLVEALAARLKPGAMLLDLGSVKQPVVEAMDALPPGVEAVGGHPMCGKADGGLAHAEPALFRDAAFVLCRTQRTSEAGLKLAKEIVAAVGARAIEMDSTQHDRIVAVVSALPYALSAALAHTAGVRAEDDLAVWSLAASGFRDTSRLAGTDPTVMADILLANGPAILKEIGAAQGVLSELARLIDAGEPRNLQVFLSQVQAYRHAWEREANSL